MKNVRATFSWFDTTFAIDNNYDLYVWGNEASVAPSDGALYRPDCIASQIQDVSYVGGLKYLLLTTRGEVLVLDAFKAAQEQACDIAGCLGTRCHTILLSGVLDFGWGPVDM